MNPLSRMVQDGAAAEEMARYLDSLSHASRRRAVEGMKRAEMALLFEKVSGSLPLDLDHFVPPEHPPLMEVVHWGKNSLPAFTRFSKRMCRPTGPADDILWGYNEGSSLVANAVGPGYFIARAGEEADTPVWIDYHQLPTGKPDHWPKVLKNSSRLSFFVYNKTIDKMRRVSEHVTIGAAYKNGRMMGAYFMLCREDVTIDQRA
jgi:hypothetical protein